MRLLIFACALIAAQAAKLQGYASQQPSTGGVSSPSLSNLDISAQTGSGGSNQQSFISSSGTFDGQTGLFSGQSVSPSHQQFTSGQSFSSPSTQSFGPSTTQSFGPSTTQSFSSPFSQSTSGSFGSGQTSFSTSPVGQFQTLNTQQSFGIDSSEFTDSVQSFSGSLSQSSGPTFSQSFSSPSGQSTSGSLGSDQASFNTSPVGQFHSINDQESFGLDSFGSSEVSEDCAEGQVRHVDGRCVTPEITRNVFVYAAPQQEPKVQTLPQNIPLPRIEHNVVFIRTQDQGEAQEPIIVPPPQRKHVIYVLNKESENQGQRVIEVTTLPPKSPEVYFVNYGEGETPTLPDGIDFNSAVNAEGQVINGGDNLVTIDGGDGFVINNSENSGFGNGLSGSSNGGLTVVSGSNVNGGDFLSGSSASGSFGVSSGGPQTFVSNGQVSDNNINNIVGFSPNNFQGSPSVDTTVPQQLYITP